MKLFVRHVKLYVKFIEILCELLYLQISLQSILNFFLMRYIRKCFKQKHLNLLNVIRKDRVFEETSNRYHYQNILNIYTLIPLIVTSLAKSAAVFPVRIGKLIGIL